MSHHIGKRPVASQQCRCHKCQTTILHATCQGHTGSHDVGVATTEMRQPSPIVRRQKHGGPQHLCQAMKQLALACGIRSPAPYRKGSWEEGKAAQQPCRPVSRLYRAEQSTQAAAAAAVQMPFRNLTRS